MAAKKWTDSAWDALISRFPALESKPEGVAFCAFAIDQGVESLPDIRELAKGLGVKLKFSGASVGSAKVAMGRASRKSRSAKAGGGKSRKAGPSKKAVGGDMKAMVAGILEELGGEIEDARGQYEDALDRLQKAKASFKKLKPVFEEYHAARAKKLAASLDGI